MALLLHASFSRLCVLVCASPFSFAASLACVAQTDKIKATTRALQCRLLVLLFLWWQRCVCLDMAANKTPNEKTPPSTQQPTATPRFRTPPLPPPPPAAASIVTTRPPAKSPRSQDREGVSLLKEIFPELSNEELYSLHQNHVLRAATPTTSSSSSDHDSRLNQKANKQKKRTKKTKRTNSRNIDNSISSSSSSGTGNKSGGDMSRSNGARRGVRGTNSGLDGSAYGNNNEGDSEANGKQQPTSKLGRRIWREMKRIEQEEAEKDRSTNGPSDKSKAPLHWETTELPDDFLRLPPDVAIRRYNEKRNKWEFTIVANLERQVLEQHRAHLDFSGQVQEMTPDENCFSRVLSRDPECGLGMTLSEQSRKVWVHSLLGTDGSRWFSTVPQHEQGGPAVQAGIRPGDWLIGINGQALIPLSGQKNVLVDAVSTIRYAQDPIVLHLRRVPQNSSHPLRSRPDGTLLSVPLDGPSLLDTTTNSFNEDGSKETIDLDDDANLAMSMQIAEQNRAKDTVHPFVKSLASKGLLQTAQGKCVLLRLVLVSLLLLLLLLLP